MKTALLSPLAAIAIASLAAGCHGGGAKRGSRPPDETGFAADDPGKQEGATVFLRGRGSDGATVHVDVVARGIDRDVHGAAFRVHWDPSKLTFQAARGSDAWSSQALLLAKEGLPGELVVAWTEKGVAAGVHVAAETVLGTLDFAPKSEAGGDLELRPDRATLRDANGAAIDAAWHGGHVEGR